MTITNLIKRLEKIREKHGDLRTFTDDGGDSHESAVSVDFSLPVVSRYRDGYVIFGDHPDYSEDLEKVVWI